MPTLAPAADLDDGPRTARSGPTRMCALTRRVMPTEGLIRFVVGPDGAVVPDLKRRLPGRGLWLTASRAAVEAALRKGVFARGFRRKVAAAPTLAADVEALIERGAREALAIAAKAGEVVAGFAKVERALGERRVAALIHGREAAADGRRKLEALARQAYGAAAAELPVIDVLNSAQLDLALGRSNVIHAALTAGPANGSVLSRCQALVRYRMAADEDFRRARATIKGDETDGSMARQRAVEHD